ncbi:MAG: TlpA disulfide reductase family protein [Dehalococcoidia bacterium]
MTRLATHNRIGLLGLLAFLGLLILTACGGTDPGPGSSTGGGSSDTTIVSLEVPDITIETYQGEEILGGTEITLSEIVGQGKPVVLNFWAALCPPCRAEMPDIQKVHETRGDEVIIIGLDIGPQQLLGTRDEGKALLAELDVHYPAGTTFDDNIVRQYRIVGMPTTLFINSDGTLLRSWSGLLNEEKFNEFIDQLS